MQFGAAMEGRGVAREDWGDDDTPQHQCDAMCRRGCSAGCSAAANSAYASHVVLGTLALLLVGALYVAMTVAVPRAPAGSITHALSSADLNVADTRADAGADVLYAEPSPASQGAAKGAAKGAAQHEQQHSGRQSSADPQPPQEPTPRRRLGTRPARRPRPGTGKRQPRRAQQHRARENGAGAGAAVEPSAEQPKRAASSA